MLSPPRIANAPCPTRPHEHMRRISLTVLCFGFTALLATTREAPGEGTPLPARGEPYAGAERCGGCHAQAYRFWREKDPHARAHLSLPPERRRDPKCTGCHSPDPGALVLGVQCESCHGAGRAYAVDFIMKDKALATVMGLRDANEARCQTCHVGHGTKAARFDYAAKVRAIVHWKK